MIVTGVRRERMPAAFEPVVEAARSRLRKRGVCSLYLYGSVATGAAQPPTSDVDLLTVGVPRGEADAIGRELSEVFAGAWFARLACLNTGGVGGGSLYPSISIGRRGTDIERGEEVLVQFQPPRELPFGAEFLEWLVEVYKSSVEVIYEVTTSGLGQVVVESPSMLVLSCGG